ncbi:MAG: hypothetical protein J6W30_04755 [Bacteroidales bacterium]|nr:hypothetical protein [Bacteroidales bacterium]
MVVLTFIMLTTPVSFAQGWGEILLGVGSALLENHIDKSSSYSSQEKESMKNNLNTINNSVNTNQKARNATKDATQGNYTGAVIQGAQTIMNATGNYQYDTYLNSANQINNANREYKQDITNGIDQQEALNKRNTTIGYSAAESAIELQDKIAQERAERARRQREAEQPIVDNYNDNYSESRNENMIGVSSSDSKTEKECQDIIEKIWQKVIDEAEDQEEQDVFEKLWQKAVDKAENQEDRVSIQKSSETNLYEFREYNSETHLLTKNNLIKFLIDEDISVALGIDKESGKMFYNNLYNDRKVKLSCNQVNIKVKYFGDDQEYTFTDACSFIMQANTFDYLDWSDLFFNISSTREIENIKLQFIDPKIK